MIEQEFDPSNKEMIERMRNIRVFSSLSERQLSEISKLSKIRKYDAGEVLIREGDYDQWVYFLVFGELAISVGATEVARIRRLGDVFGEMGIIDGSPRSASITALKPTICLAVDGAILERLAGPDKIIAQALFYRIFAEMLAERLRKVNAKVTSLEAENAELRKVRFPKV